MPQSSPTDRDLLRRLTHPMEIGWRVLNDLEEAERKLALTYCAYCGHEVPMDGKAASEISQHIATCPKHPMRDVEKERDALKDLVLHCWIHSGYRDCGFNQMTTEMKALYERVKAEANAREEEAVIATARPPE